MLFQRVRCGICQCHHRWFSVTLIGEACKKLHSNAAPSPFCSNAVAVTLLDLLNLNASVGCLRHVEEVWANSWSVPFHLGPGGSAAAFRQTEFSNSTKTTKAWNVFSPACFGEESVFWGKEGKRMKNEFRDKSSKQWLSSA